MSNHRLTDGPDLNPISDLIQQMVAKKDAALRQAISKKLGRDDWTLKEVAERMEREMLPSGRDRFFLDGELILDISVDIDSLGKHAFGISE